MEWESFGNRCSDVDTTPLTLVARGSQKSKGRSISQTPNDHSYLMMALPIGSVATNASGDMRCKNWNVQMLQVIVSNGVTAIIEKELAYKDEDNCK